MEHEIMIYTPDELYFHLVDYDQDEPTEKIKEISDRLRYFNMGDIGYNERNLFFVLKGNDKIIGVAKVRIDGPYSLSHNKFNKWISYISIDKEYYGKGIATALVDAVMYYAAEHKIELLCSGYTLRGWMYLRPTLHRIASQYGVTIEDPAVKPEFYHSKGEGWPMDEYNRLWDKFRFQSIAV